jgi:serine/threonine protein kinase
MSDFWIGPVAAPDTYRLVSLLGGGGEGEVWKAVLPLSSEGRRSVAIKITRAKGDQGDWERFGHLLRSLSHPGLVRITDVFTGPAMHRQGEIAAGDGADGNNLRYVVMDYIDGINLREWSAEKPETTVSQRLRLLGMVAAALDEMHSGATTEVAVAHGDVKPANIVVRSDGAAILVDLGLARLADAGGVPGRSAAYAAPELRSRGALATPGADRYAFAVTTAHLLTGQTPPIGEDGWLDTQALRALLESSPLTARRHLLIQRIMTMISAPPEARTSQLRPWLDAAVESLSQATSTGLSAVAAPQVDSPTQPPRTVDTPAPHTPEAASDSDAGRGEQFGPYRLERLLGRGGMGEVYRALDTGRNRVVALKRLPAALADDPEFKARFREESRLAAQLNEPHIIPIHDFGEINGHLFIDMRLVEGTDLAHLLADTGALSPARAVHIVRQVADALDSAHAAGLVHRDVKPANILLRSAQTDTGTDFDDGNDFAYLVDFGIARATSDPGLTGTGGAIGSVTYMAPERFHGHSDHRADIYSLGCLLYEAVTAHRPFDVTDTAAAIHAHLYNEPPRPSAANPSVPVALDAVIAKAMAKDPDQRYATAGALAAAARSALTLAGGPPVPDAADAGTTHIPPGAHPEPHYWADPPTMPIDLRLTAAPTPSATTPPLASKSNRRSLALAGTLVALLVLAIAGIGAYRFLAARAPTPPNGPTLSVAQEPIQTPGADPFMPSVGKDVPNTRQPPGSHGVYDGGTPGLYGGTLNNAECDRPSMISFLQTNPDKAAAWATVENISPTDVPAYINQLTPVILRGDTAVTNHGFKDGHPTTLQSVLQTGTAVLVDPFGVPRARCYCGNPLSPPDRPNNANYAPPAWPLFNPSNVLTSHPHGAPLIEFTLIDLTTNTPIRRPTGTSGEKDLPQQPPPPPATTAAPHPRVPVPVTHTPTHPITRPTEDPVQPSPRKCPDGYKLVDDECTKKSTGGGSESNTTTPPPPSINPCDRSKPSTYDPEKC